MAQINPREIFVSYAHEDSTIADHVSDVLSDLNVSFFKDDRSIKLGESILTEVHESIRNCSGLLVILSKASLSPTSKWVPYEIGYARALGKLVLPLVVDGAEVPLYLKGISYASSLEELRIYFEEAYPIAKIEIPAIRPAIDDADFVQRISGHWWELFGGIHHGHSISFASISSPLMTIPSLKFEGIAFGLGEKDPYPWQSVSTGVNLEQLTLSYFWKGRRPSKRTRRNAGFALIEFDQAPVSSVYWSGRGVFTDSDSDLLFADESILTCEKIVFDFVRATDAEAKVILGFDQAAKWECARRKLKEVSSG